LNVVIDNVPRHIHIFIGTQLGALRHILYTQDTICDGFSDGGDIGQLIAIRKTNGPEAILQSKQLSVASYPDDNGTLLITIQSGTLSSAQLLEDKALLRDV
jgi:hypothetical protein